MLKKYLFLTKPGILFGNFITTLGGFFLAAQGSIDCLLLLLTLIGTTLVVASGCVVNNVIDQDIDQKMQRTMNRALVTKTISPTIAMFYAFVLGVIGFSVLWFYVNAYALTKNHNRAKPDRPKTAEKIKATVGLMVFLTNARFIVRCILWSMS